jgi:hypothetical protein
MRSPRSSSCASALLKSSTCGRAITDAQRNEFEVLVDDTVRRIESGMFLRTLASASPRIHVLPVLCSRSASTSAICWSLAWSANRESTLVCLTNLRTNGAPLQIKKQDWEARHDSERDTKFVELASFDEFLERRFPKSRRKAYYIVSIHKHSPYASTGRHVLRTGTCWSRASEPQSRRPAR